MPENPSVEACEHRIWRPTADGIICKARGREEPRVIASVPLADDQPTDEPKPTRIASMFAQIKTYAILVGLIIGVLAYASFGISVRDAGWCNALPLPIALLGFHPAHTERDDGGCPSDDSSLATITR